MSWRYVGLVSLFGCVHSTNTPTPAPRAESIPARAAPAEIPQAAIAEAEESDLCSGRYVDAAGVWRYDLGCDDATGTRSIDQSIVGYNDKCVRDYRDAAGIARYDFSCEWRDPNVDEVRERKIACVMSGGDWGRHGTVSYEGCAWRARDSGKTCSDADECESRVCEPNADANVGARGVGVCRQCVGDCAPSVTTLRSGFVRRMK